MNSEEGTINLGFVVLYVQDVQKMEVFYTHVLGLSVVEEVSSATFVTLRSGGDFLLALQDKTVASASRPRRPAWQRRAELRSG